MNVGKNLGNFLKGAECEPNKVMSAVVNNRGYGGFRIMNIVGSKNSLNIVPRRNLKTSKGRGLGLLGSGEFGKAYIGCINKNYKKQVAVKIQTNKSILKHEFEIMKKVFDIVPHVTIPYLYKDCKSYGILYTEYANGGDFENLFENYQRVLTHQQIRTLVFQTLFTVYSIQKQYPTFRHFDLHPGNVFFDTNFPRTGATKYTTHSDVKHNFRLPNIGIRCLIGDFGLASMSGQLSNNVKSLKYRNNYGVGPNTNKLFDAHFFLMNLYDIMERQNMSHTGSFRVFIRENFPKEYIPEMSNKVSKGRLRYNVNHNKLPTLQKLLDDPYFRPFRLIDKGFVPSNITNTYPKKHNVNLFKQFQAKLKPLKIGKRSPVSPTAYKNKVKKPVSPPKKAPSPSKKRTVVPRALIENMQQQANNANKQRILAALKARVATKSPVKKVVAVIAPKRKKKMTEVNTFSSVKVGLKALVPPPKPPQLLRTKVTELKKFIQDAGVKVEQSSAANTVVVAAPKASVPGKVSDEYLWRKYKDKLSEEYYDTKIPKSNERSYDEKMNEARAHALKIIRANKAAKKAPPQL